MSKKISLAVFIVTIMILFVGCDPNIGFDFSVNEGTWGYEDGGYIFIMYDSESTGLDITWYSGDYEYNAYLDGTTDGAVFTGEYYYHVYDTVGETYTTDTFDDPRSNCSITFSLIDGKLKAVCTGEGILDGKTFIGGVYEPI
jgi:hypothetical protein